MLIVPLSLSDRFRGALLGAALGEILGANYQYRLNSRVTVPWLDVDQWGFESLPDGSGVAWGQLAIEQIQAIIQSGQTNSLFIGKNLVNATSADWMGLTIAALPIALFYHDDWHQLHAVVQEKLANTPHSSALSTAILTIGYILSLTLQEQLHLPNLISQLIAALDLQTTLPPLAQHLEQIQSCYQDRKDLLVARSIAVQPVPEATVSTPVTIAPVTIALHSFLQTPHNFRVSLLRTARLNHQPQIACAIVGALSGAYNGIAALPLTWRRRLHPMADRSPVLASFWRVSSEAELLQHADLLFSTWSGVHALHPLIQSPQNLVTATPGVIRPR